MEMPGSTNMLVPMWTPLHHIPWTHNLKYFLHWKHRFHMHFVSF